MKQEQLIDIILAKTGQLTIDGKECRCKICNGHGKVETVAPGFIVPSVDHTRRCAAACAVKDFLHDLKGANFLLEVENLVPYDEIEEYEEELSPAELKEIEKLTNDIFIAATEKELKKLYPRIAEYDNHDVSSPVLARIAKHGIETPTERENLKSFLIYLKAHQGTVDDFMLRAMEIENERVHMAHLFDQAFPV